MDIVLASRNKKKITELKNLLSVLGGDITVLSLDDIGYHDDTEENGATFIENSFIKAAVPAKLGYIGVADDSGLCVDALGGAPGIYSARFSGEDATDEKNNEKLLQDLSDISGEDRSAHFACAVTCVFPEKMSDVSFPNVPYLRDVSDEFPTVCEGLRAFSVTGAVNGVILDSPRGSSGFGYDPLFYIPDKGRTFAELTQDEKNEISHRGQAMSHFVSAFGEILKGLQC